MAVGVVIYGYQTTPLTVINEPVALDFAPKAARFEMNCPGATDPDASAEATQAPAFQAPAFGPRFMGTQRVSFTIGATGCDRRSQASVECADESDGCFAADE